MSMDWAQVPQNEEATGQFELQLACGCRSKLLFRKLDVLGN